MVEDRHADVSCPSVAECLDAGQHDRAHLDDREDVVEPEPLGIDGSARGGGVAGAESFGWEEGGRPRRSGSPEGRCAPGDVLERIPQMDELPVEDAAEMRPSLILDDQEVSKA